VVPPVASTANGIATFTYDDTSDKLYYTIKLQAANNVIGFVRVHMCSQASRALTLHNAAFGSMHRHCPELRRQRSRTSVVLKRTHLGGRAHLDRSNVFWSSDPHRTSIACRGSMCVCQCLEQRRIEWLGVDLEQAVRVPGRRQDVRAGRHVGQPERRDSRPARDHCKYDDDAHACRHPQDHTQTSRQLVHRLARLLARVQLSSLQLCVEARWFLPFNRAPAAMVASPTTPTPAWYVGRRALLVAVHVAWTHQRSTPTQITYNLKHDVQRPRAVHIHGPADEKDNGPVILTLDSYACSFASVALARDGSLNDWCSIAGVLAGPTRRSKARRS